MDLPITPPPPPPCPLTPYPNRPLPTRAPSLPGLAACSIAGSTGRFWPGMRSSTLSKAVSQLSMERAKLTAVDRVSPGIGVKMARVSGVRWHHTASCWPRVCGAERGTIMRVRGVGGGICWPSVCGVEKATVIRVRGVGDGVSADPASVE